MKAAFSDVVVVVAPVLGTVEDTKLVSTVNIVFKRSALWMITVLRHEFLTPNKSARASLWSGLSMFIGLEHFIINKLMLGKDRAE